MKNINKLAAAVALTLAAGSASAAWIDGTTPGAPSSVAFQIDDTVTKQTFVLDLAVGHAGLNYASFQNGTEGVAAGLSWDLSALGGSLFSGFASHTAGFKWSVVASYQFDGVDLSNVDKSGAGTYASFYNDPNNAQWGVLSTGQAATSFAQQDFSTIQTEADSTGKVGAWTNRLNASTAANGAPIASINPIDGTSFYEKYLSSLATLGNGPGAPSFTGAASANFYWISNAELNEFDNQIVQLGTFTLDANNILTYQGVSEVPVPGAVWLFGSAVLGMLGFTRRGAKVIAA